MFYRRHIDKKENTDPAGDIKRISGTELATTESKTRAMTANSHDSRAQATPEESRLQPQASADQARRSFFKYYIHDGTASCRLQLIGQLTDANLPELSGCWRTARTILGNRTLILDLTGLNSVDDAGKQWLASMSQEGAIYVPEDFLRTSLADRSPEAERPSHGWFGKLIALLGGGLIKQEP